MNSGGDQVRPRPAESGGPLQLSWHDHAQPRSDLARLEAVVAKALPLVWNQPGAAPSVLPDLEEVEISLLDDRTIAAVHGDFLDDPSPTDVITFHHGEILVSTETAAREAAARGDLALRETALYVIHGLLHLHGHTDADPAARAVMHAAQDRILQAVWPSEDGR